ncbi:MAG: tetratricopeptide repeat protein [Bacilli bacterium]|nr:tetratricopeptide repeat protein [Bacilli bacterium]
MIYEHHDNWKLGRIVDLATVNPEEALLKYEEYLEKYPKDYSAYTDYAYTLLVLGRVEEAEKLMEFTERQIEKRSDNHFNYVIKNKIRLFILQERYEELYDLCLEYPDIDDNINPIIVYCKEKLGILKSDDVSNTGYLCHQISNYQEEEFLNHIERHLDSDNLDQDERSAAYFSYDFPLEKILKESRKYIPSSLRVLQYYISNTYFFKYDACGKVENQTADYFRLVTIHDTDKYITMFPSIEGEGFPYVNLNYLREKEEKPKVKVKSQVEKFNQRYSKK